MYNELPWLFSQCEQNYQSILDRGTAETLDDYWALMLPALKKLASYRGNWQGGEKWVEFKGRPILLISYSCALMTFRQLPRYFPLEGPGISQQKPLISSALARKIGLRIDNRAPLGVYVDSDGRFSWKNPLNMRRSLVFHILWSQRPFWRACKGLWARTIFFINA